MRRNEATAEGRELGKRLAKLCDDAEPAARLQVPELPPRCDSCAFREGPHVANGSPETLMDAVKCIVEGVPFHCHDHRRPGHLCSGWTMMMLTKSAGVGKVPWDFSDGTDDKAEFSMRTEG